MNQMDCVHFQTQVDEQFAACVDVKTLMLAYVGMQDLLRDMFRKHMGRVFSEPDDMIFDKTTWSGTPLPIMIPMKTDTTKPGGINKDIMY